MDILLLILLMAARILSRLSVPPQSRRGYQPTWLSAREKPLTRHAPADDTAGA